MKTIWKYRLETGYLNKQQLKMPRSARIVHLDVQSGFACVWALIDDSTIVQEEVREFRIVGTGGEIPHQSVYVGTWQDGPFVWHLFELAPRFA